MALMHFKSNNWLHSVMLKDKITHSDKPLKKITISIRQELQYIYNNLHNLDGEKTSKCVNLRKLIKQFDLRYRELNNISLKPTNWTSTQEDPADVITILLGQIFKVPNNMRVKTVISSNKKKKKESRFENVSFDSQKVIMYDDTTLYMSDIAPHSTFKNKLDSGEEHTTQTIIIEADMLYIPIIRNITEKKSKTHFIPEESIIISEDILECVSILLHHGSDADVGHYTCCFKYTDDLWYHFDDMKSKLTRIGKFADVLRWNHEFVFENSTGFLYISKKYT